MGEDCLPDAQLEFVQEIHDKQGEDVLELELRDEGTLKGNQRQPARGTRGLTRVGVRDCGPITWSTAFEFTAYPLS